MTSRTTKAFTTSKKVRSTFVLSLVRISIPSILDIFWFQSASKEGILTVINGQSTSLLKVAMSLRRANFFRTGVKTSKRISLLNNLLKLAYLQEQANWVTPSSSRETGIQIASWCLLRPLSLWEEMWPFKAKGVTKVKDMLGSQRLVQSDTAWRNRPAVHSSSLHK